MGQGLFPVLVFAELLSCSQHICFLVQSFSMPEEGRPTRFPSLEVVDEIRACEFLTG